MNTKQLSYVVAIAECQSLSGAAAQLGISQPALSKYLAKLQEELGLELFFSYKKKMFPTAAGNTYLDGARQIISLKELAYQNINRLSSAPTTTITVGATPLRGSIQVAQTMHLFLNRYPNFAISIREGYMHQLRNDIRSAKVDFALGTCTDELDTDINHILISKEEVVLAVPEFHPLASRANPTLDALAVIDIRLFQDTPFILGGKGSSLQRIAKSVFKQTGMSPTILYESNNNLVLENMLKSGVGIGFVPKSSIRAGEGIVYFSLQPKYYMWLCMMYSKNHILTESERYFVYLILQNDLKEARYINEPNAIAKQIYKEFSL